MIEGRPPRLAQIYQSHYAPLFFITMCTLHRRKIPSLRVAQEVFGTYSARGMSGFNVAVGRYVIMPDHLHFFVRSDQNVALSRWVKGLKQWGYVRQNPVRAGLVKLAEDWPYQGEIEIVYIAARVLTRRSKRSRLETAASTPGTIAGPAVRDALRFPRSLLLRNLRPAVL
jgi:putative transposase